MVENNFEKCIQDQFDQQAEKFSSWSVTKNEEYAGAYYDFCEITPGDRLLDVSCGSGEFCLFCARNITRAAGFDLSGHMIALAEKQSEELNITNTTFQQGNAVNLPIESGMFTIVISKSAFHHYSEHDLIFTEMKRCCSEQGRISVQDIVTYNDKYVNNFFESFEKLVDASHNATCSRNFILEMYQKHGMEILSTMDVTIDLDLNDYLGHAVRTESDTAVLNRLIEKGLKDKIIGTFFHRRKNHLYFKRNVFIVLGKKQTK